MARVRPRDRFRRELESRDHLAAALNTLRLREPPVIIQMQQEEENAPPSKGGVAPKGAGTVHSSYEGLLTMIDCREGITLILRKDDQFIRFHTKTPIHLEFISKTSNAANEAACGLVRPEHHVIVTYLRKKVGDSLGEPIRIEYR